MADPLRAYAVILAGGRGTRFWPLSRARRPKQLLPLAPPRAGRAGRNSLLQETYRLVRPLFPPSRIFVVTGREHAREVRRQLRTLPIRNLLAEPVGRNTAAAIALAAAHIRQHEDKDALLAVFPADQVIARPARLRQLVRAALGTTAAQPCVVVLGFTPTYPATGYGYIERGKLWRRVLGEPVLRARRFTEKPERATAERYLRSGRYYWNGGMFFWRLSTFENLLARYLPATARAMEEIAAAIGTRGYDRRLARLYPRLQNISVDYALLERAPQVRLLAADIGWSDLGSWAALYHYLAARRGENVARGELFAHDAQGNLIWSDKKFAALVGVRDLVVVETPDALLVTSSARAQEVGQVVKYLEKKKRRELL